MLPKGYGLPKVHKPDIPLRIDTSAINSSCDKLAKIVYKELNLCIKKSQSHSDNSLALNERLTNKPLAVETLQHNKTTCVEFYFN